MTMHPSTSSQVAAYGHDAARSVLRVRFRSGATYEYEGVDAEKFAELRASDSHGKFVHNRVKPHHAAKKISDAESIPLAIREEAQ